MVKIELNRPTPAADLNGRWVIASWSGAWHAKCTHTQSSRKLCRKYPKRGEITATHASGELRPDLLGPSPELFHCGSTSVQVGLIEIQLAAIG